MQEGSCGGGLKGGRSGGRFISRVYCKYYAWCWWRPPWTAKPSQYSPNHTTKLLQSLNWNPAGVQLTSLASAFGTLAPNQYGTSWSFRRRLVRRTTMNNAEYVKFNLLHESRLMDWLVIYNPIMASIRPHIWAWTAEAKYSNSKVMGKIWNALCCSIQHGAFQILLKEM